MTAMEFFSFSFRPPGARSYYRRFPTALTRVAPQQAGPRSSARIYAPPPEGFRQPSLDPRLAAQRLPQTSFSSPPRQEAKTGKLVVESSKGATSTASSYKRCLSSRQPPLRGRLPFPFLGFRVFRVGRDLYLAAPAFSRKRRQAAGRESLERFLLTDRGEDAEDGGEYFSALLVLEVLTKTGAFMERGPTLAAPLDVEVVSGVLFVFGSVDRRREAEMREALTKFCRETPPDKRIVDMSNVRFFATPVAKVLISVAQDSEEQGGRMRIMASRAVLQTLSLLGAKSWLDIVVCARPNPKPTAAQKAESPKKPANKKTPPPREEPPREEPPSQKELAAPLVDAAEANGVAPAVFKHLSAGRTYRFHFGEGAEMTGKAAEWLGGPWLAVEAHTGSRLLNVSAVQWIEPL